MSPPISFNLALTSDQIAEPARLLGEIISAPSRATSGRPKYSIAH